MVLKNEIGKIELTPEQKNAIYSHLSRINLGDFQEFFEEVLRSGDFALGLMFVDAVKAKVEKETRSKLIELQNMRLASITGGLFEGDWSRTLDTFIRGGISDGKQNANGNQGTAIGSYRSGATGSPAAHQHCQWPTQ